MIKKVLYFLSMVIVLGSCSSDEGNVEAPILLTKKIQTFGDGSKFIMNFKYDNNKLLEMYGDGFKANVSYDGNLIESIKYYNGSVLNQEDLYFYDNDQRLTKFIRNEYRDNVLEGIEDFRYTYNTDATTSFSEYRMDGVGNELILITTGTVKLNSLGEIVSMENSFDETYKYSYDDKNSPFKNVLGIGKTFLSDSRPEFGFHNILKIEGNNGEISNYTYNSNNFPITETNIDGNETVKTEYFYNK